MSILGDTLGKSFLGSTCIPLVPPTAATGSPAELSPAAWTVRNSAANNNFEIEIFDLPEGLDVDMRAGSVNEPWETISLTGPGVFVNPHAVPTGVAIKVWLRLRNAAGGYSVTSYFKQVTVTNTQDPAITVGQIGVNVTSLNVPWSTDTAQGTGFVLVDQVAAHSGAEVAAGGGVYSGSVAVTQAGTQPAFAPSGLAAETGYFVHVVHRDGAQYSDVVTTPITTQAAPAGTVVTTPAEFYAAISDGARNILLPDMTCTAAAGWRHLLQAAPVKDFTGDPLTIQAQDPDKPPVFYSAQQDMAGCHHVTWRNIRVENAGNMTKNYPGWFFDGGVNGGVEESCSHITVEFVSASGPTPGDLNDTTKDANYGFHLVRFTRFRNRNSHSNKIRYCHVEDCYELCNGMNASGNWEVIGNTVERWYFDCLRILGCPEDYYVEGDALVAYNDFGSCIGRYEEIDSASPHPDITQIFNSAEGARPAVRNLLFYQNRFAPGHYRGINVQAGLAQSKLVNVGYVENLWTPRGNTHGISMEDGADGVLIERQILCNSNLGGGNTALRIYDATGQVLVKDSLFVELILGDQISPPQSNAASFELELINSAYPLDYADFTGPGAVQGAAAQQAALTPRSDLDGRGALTPGGTFRNLPHVPMKAKAPALTALGGGQVRIEAIREPTLMSLKQVAQGGTAYTRRDLRYSASGHAGSWTVLGDVAEGDSVSLPAGAMQVQTRLWTAAGQGLGSETAGISVN